MLPEVETLPDVAVNAASMEGAFFIVATACLSTSDAEVPALPAACITAGNNADNSMIIVRNFIIKGNNC